MSMIVLIVPDGDGPGLPAVHGPFASHDKAAEYADSKRSLAGSYTSEVTPPYVPKRFEAGLIGPKHFIFRVHLLRRPWPRGFTIGFDIHWRPWGLSLYSCWRGKETFRDLGSVA